jgi:GNAT superfamily N-acetyltransferase
VSGQGGVEVRPILLEDRRAVAEVLRERWGSERMVRNGELFRPAELRGFVATLDGLPAGYLTFMLHADTFEIAWLDAVVERRGVGSALVDAATDAAREQGCLRMVVTTTNDNFDAVRFYQRRGFHLAELRRGAAASARAIKPEIPALGDHGIPIRDELELELIL